MSILCYEFVEKLDTNVNKNGTVNAGTLIEIIQLEDNSYWILLLHHINNSGSNLFPKGIDGSKYIYKNEDCWCNFGLINEYHTGSDYEFLVIQKEGNDFVNHRWIQTINPMIATFDNTKHADITSILNINNNYGGMYYVNGDNRIMNFNNNVSDNWFCCGARNPHQGGIPGYNNVIVKENQEVYMRIYPEFITKFYQDKIITDEFIEI